MTAPVDDLTGLPLAPRAGAARPVHGAHRLWARARALALLRGAGLLVAFIAPSAAGARQGHRAVDPARYAFTDASPLAVGVGGAARSLTATVASRHVPNPAFAGYLATRRGSATVQTQFKFHTLDCTRQESAISPGAFLLVGPADHENFEASNIIIGCYGGKAVTEEALIINGDEVDYLKELHQGDTVRVRLSERPGGSVVVQLRDLTRGHAFTVTRRGSGQAADAELVGDWGSVDAQTGDQVPPPQFGTLTFGSAIVGGKALGANAPTAYNMRTSKSVLQISTGPLLGGARERFETKRQRRS